MAGRPPLPGFAQLCQKPLEFDLQHEFKADLAGPGNKPRHGFETVESCVAEDCLRAAFLKRIGGRAALRLAELLDESALDFAHDTQASATYCRQLRRVETDVLWKYMASRPAHDLHTCTILQAGWQVSGDDLPTFNTTRMLKQFRAKVTNGRPCPPGEWLFGRVHGEFDSRIKMFQMHVHGICTRHFVPRQRRRDTGRPVPGIRVPVQFKPIRDPARQISYLTQSFWPDRPTYWCDGEWERSREKRRIREPWGSQVLLWLHRQTLGTMQIKVGLTNGTYSPQVRNSA